MSRRINKWDKVNWHTILHRNWDTIFFECWRCWSFSKKSRANLYKNTWCSNCAKSNQQLDFSLRTRCWILWLYLPTIKSRIQRWWTIKEALYQEKRVFKESLSSKDLLYINSVSEKTYKENKLMGEKSYLKYKTRINYN